LSYLRTLLPERARCEHRSKFMVRAVVKGHAKVRLESDITTRTGIGEFLILVMSETHCIPHQVRISFINSFMGAHMGKEQEGVLSTAKDAIADTAKAGLDVAATGIVATKDAALTVAKAGADIAAAGLVVTKDAALAAGTAIGETASSLAKRAKKAIRRKPRAEKATLKKKKATLKKMAVGKKPRKSAASKKPTSRKTSAKKPTRKTAGKVSARRKTSPASSRKNASKKR
jgi:hypothetical protein